MDTSRGSSSERKRVFCFLKVNYCQGVALAAKSDRTIQSVPPHLPLLVLVTWCIQSNSRGRARVKFHFIMEWSHYKIVTWTDSLQSDAGSQVICGIFKGRGVLSAQSSLNSSLIWALGCLGSFRNPSCKFPSPACTLLHLREAGITSVTLLNFPNTNAVSTTIRKPVRKGWEQLQTQSHPCLCWAIYLCLPRRVSVFFYLLWYFLQAFYFMCHFGRFSKAF